MDPESQVRRGLLARTLFETLRGAGGPLAPKDALASVASRVSPNKQELSHNASGFPRYETYLRWVSTWSSAIGWMAKRGGWSITEAGVEAIAEFAGDEFVSELTRRYRRHRKQKQPNQSDSGDPRWAEVVKALGYVEAGWWTTYGDLATLTGLAARSVGTLLRTEKVDNGHRVLRPNGSISPDFHWGPTLTAVTTHGRYWRVRDSGSTSPGVPTRISGHRRRPVGATGRARRRR